MTDEKMAQFLSLTQHAAEMQTLQNVVLSTPRSGQAQKIRCTLRQMSDGLYIQLEYRYTEGRVRQRNLSLADFLDEIQKELKHFARADLNDSGGSASLLFSRKGKITLVTHGSIGDGDKLSIAGNNRKKRYILDGSEPFLMQLGISNEKGRVHDKKQAKFRQINRFLELIRDILNELPTEGILYIADLCCGKSYLSFAVYHYLVHILHRKVVMDCMDLKESVMRDCADIALRCNFTEMYFQAGDVSKYAPEHPVHLLVSLHACDTATDLVLDRGIALGAKVILSTPCCHRQLSRELDCAPLSFIARHPVLKYKFCDAATDALRILRLEAAGYTCDALEFTDPEDTPKNVLIRAIRRDSMDYKETKSRDRETRYRQAYAYLTGKEASPLPDKI